MPSRYVGQSVRRLEDQRFLRGAGLFTDDVSRPEQLHAVFVRSPYAHALIASIDGSAAQSHPGVVAVLTGDDYASDGCQGVRHFPNPADPVDITRPAFISTPESPVIDLPHWPLARGKVRHVGEPVAIVVATTRAMAKDGAELVAVSYDELPSVISPLDAVAEGAPILWSEVPGNTCLTSDYGNAEAVEQGIANSHCIIRQRFFHNRVSSCHLEPRAALGDYDSQSGLHTLVSGGQGVHAHRIAVAAALGVSLDKVRVICPDVGGGFGTRTNLYPEQLAVVWAAKKLARPVKWTADRTESFQSDFNGREAVVDATLALDAHGRIRAYKLDWFGNVGAHTVAFVAIANGRRIPASVYDVPVAHVRSHAVLTNTVPTSAYRGAGRPESIHMLERLLDMAARKLHIDRVEIRQRNLIQTSQMPFRSVMDIVYDSGDFRRYMEQALVHADWAGFPRRRANALARGRVAGIGLANHLSGPVGAPFERAQVSISSEDTVNVILGTQSSGQGHETSFAQIVADALQMPIESVRIRYGDTEFVSLGGGTHSERSLRISGTLVHKAAAEIIQDGLHAASGLLEVAAEDIHYESGLFKVQGTDRSISLFALARAAAAGKCGQTSQLSSTQDFTGRIPAYPAGCAVCEVEVDPETGQVFITRYTTADDAGRQVNPMLVAGQTHGGIAQGVGQALMEGIVYDPESGQLLSGSFMDYCLPRADDFPQLVAGHAEHRTMGNPLHIKGGAEAGIMPATAAVINAICDALSPRTNTELLMPATSSKVWSALQH